MKMLLVVVGLALGARAAFGQSLSIPPKDAISVIIHTPDSAKAAHAKVVQQLLASGYAIDRNDKEALFISTPPKSADGALYTKLQAFTVSEPGGSATTFRATFSVTNAATLAAHVEGREMPVRYTGAGSNPMKRAWAELTRMALAAFPNGQVAYGKP